MAQKLFTFPGICICLFICSVKGVFTIFSCQYQTTDKENIKISTVDFQIKILSQRFVKRGKNEKRGVEETEVQKRGVETELSSKGQMAKEVHVMQ